VVLPGKSLGSRDTVNSGRCILVPLLRGFGVPVSSFFEVDRNIDSNLVKISHGEFCSREAALSRPLSIFKCNLIVFFKNAFMATKGPLANGHLGFRFSLSSRKSIVVQGQCGIEVAA
jgi:hypothetical protein